MEKVTFETVRETFYKHNEVSENLDKDVLKAVIVFTASSFNEEYTETERSYEVKSNAKLFIPSMISNSLLGNCLDGKDLGVRLDNYMYGGWIIDYCYFVK